MLACSVGWVELEMQNILGFHLTDSLFWHLFQLTDRLSSHRLIVLSLNLTVGSFSFILSAELIPSFNVLNFSELVWH